MTKKHFVALADTIKTLKPTTNSEGSGTFVNPQTLEFASYYYNVTVNRLADFCQSQNSEFNREKFISYIKGD